MSYIFIDESGDLGFDKEKYNSKYFIITALFIPEKKPLEKIVKKVYSTLRKKIKAIGGGVLHSVKEKPATRKRLLKLLLKLELSIMVICLDKSKVYTDLQNEKHILYNYITNILINRIFTKKLIDKDKNITLIASKRETNKYLNLNFRDYLKSVIKNNHKLDIDVLIKTPSEEKSLQVVDFVSWAIFRKYEFGDFEYYRVIKDLVVEENKLYK
ncbi:MAG: DUF3800 domain-containing protein [Patescibacteria group bacterium]